MSTHRFIEAETISTKKVQIYNTSRTGYLKLEYATDGNTNSTIKWPTLPTAGSSGYLFTDEHGDMKWESLSGNIPDSTSGTTTEILKSDGNAGWAKLAAPDDTSMPLSTVRYLKLEKDGSGATTLAWSSVDALPSAGNNTLELLVSDGSGGWTSKAAPSGTNDQFLKYTSNGTTSSIDWTAVTLTVNETLLPVSDEYSIIHGDGTGLANTAGTWTKLNPPSGGSVKAVLQYDDAQATKLLWNQTEHHTVDTIVKSAAANELLVSDGTTTNWAKLEAPTSGSDKFLKYTDNASLGWGEVNMSTTFVVTYDSGYVFQGGQTSGDSTNDKNPELYLTRGKTYVFNASAVIGSHKLYIQTNSLPYTGGSAALYTDNSLTGNGTETITFTPQHDTPSILYYQCENNDTMDGTIYIVGGTDSGHVPASTASNEVLVSNFQTDEKHGWTVLAAPTSGSDRYLKYTDGGSLSWGELNISNTITVGYGDDSGTTKYWLSGNQTLGASGDYNPTLYLTRGQTYVFDVTSSVAAGHPMYINTVSGTGTSNQYSDASLTGNGTNTVTFTPQWDAPDTLYYNCQNHAAMAGTIYITGTFPTASETKQLLVSGSTGSAASNWSPLAAPTGVSVLRYNGANIDWDSEFVAPSTLAHELLVSDYRMVDGDVKDGWKVLAPPSSDKYLKYTHGDGSNSTLDWADVDAMPAASAAQELLYSTNSGTSNWASLSVPSGKGLLMHDTTVQWSIPANASVLRYDGTNISWDEDFVAPSTAVQQMLVSDFVNGSKDGWKVLEAPSTAKILRYDGSEVKWEFDIAPSTGAHTMLVSDGSTGWGVLAAPATTTAGEQKFLSYLHDDSNLAWTSLTVTSDLVSLTDVDTTTSALVVNDLVQCTNTTGTASFQNKGGSTAHPLKLDLHLDSGSILPATSGKTVNLGAWDTPMNLLTTKDLLVKGDEIRLHPSAEDSGVVFTHHYVGATGGISNRLMKYFFNSYEQTSAQGGVLTASTVTLDTSTTPNTTKVYLELKTPNGLPVVESNVNSTLTLTDPGYYCLNSSCGAVNISNNMTVGTRALIITQDSVYNNSVPISTQDSNKRVNGVVGGSLTITGDDTHSLFLVVKSQINDTDDNYIVKKIGSGGFALEGSATQHQITRFHDAGTTLKASNVSIDDDDNLTNMASIALTTDANDSTKTFTVVPQSQTAANTITLPATSGSDNHVLYRASGTSTTAATLDWTDTIDKARGIVSSGANFTASLGDASGLLSGMRQIKLDAATTGSLTFKTPSSMTDNYGTNYIFTMPPDSGAQHEVLTTDGTGTLTWTRPKAGELLSANGTNVMTISDLGVVSSTGTGVTNLTLMNGESNTCGIDLPTTGVTNWTMTLPVNVGAANQILKGDVDGNLSWTDSALSITSPDLGTTVSLDNSGVLDGALQVNVGTGNTQIQIKSNTGMASAYALTFPQSLGTAGQVLTTDGASGDLAWTSAAGISASEFAYGRMYCHGDDTVATFTTNYTLFDDFTGSDTMYNMTADTSTGKFTIGLPGVYELSWYLTDNGGGNDRGAQIYKNGQAHGRAIWGQADGIGNFLYVVFPVMEFVTGDEIQIYVKSSIADAIDLQNRNGDSVAFTCKLVGGSIGVANIPNSFSTGEMLISNSINGWQRLAAPATSGDQTLNYVGGTPVWENKGTFSSVFAYGRMCMTSTSTAMEGTLGTTFKTFEFDDGSLVPVNMTMDITNNKFVITQAGYYECSMHWHIGTGSSYDYFTAVAVNGSIVTKQYLHQNFNAGGAFGIGNIFETIYLNADDEVTLQVKASSSDGSIAGQDRDYDTAAYFDCKMVNSVNSTQIVVTQSLTAALQQTIPLSGTVSSPTGYDYSVANFWTNTNAVEMVILLKSSNHDHQVTVHKNMRALYHDASFEFMKLDDNNFVVGFDSTADNLYFSWTIGRPLTSAQIYYKFSSVASTGQAVPSNVNQFPKRWEFGKTLVCWAVGSMGTPTNKGFLLQGTASYVSSTTNTTVDIIANGSGSQYGALSWNAGSTIDDFEMRIKIRSYPGSSHGDGFTLFWNADQGDVDYDNANSELKAASGTAISGHGFTIHFYSNGQPYRWNNGATLLLGVGDSSNNGHVSSITRNQYYQNWTVRKIGTQLQVSVDGNALDNSPILYEYNDVGTLPTGSHFGVAARTGGATQWVQVAALEIRQLGESSTSVVDEVDQFAWS